MNNLTISRFPALGYACNEAINTLCTNLSFSREDVKKIMITSCHASEGKSFLSMNIMRSLTKLGKTVALVDADLRRSMISSKYNLQFQNEAERWGLSHLLAGMANEDQVIYRTNMAGAYMVPVGKEVLNSLSLLVSPRFEELLNHLAQNVDYVIVDAPPVGTVIDAAEIAKSCDGTLIVVNYNEVHRQELLDVKEQLEQTDCPILGTILNQVEYDNYLSRKYYYKSYYSSYERYDKTPQTGRSSAKKDSRTVRK